MSFDALAWAAKQSPGTSGSKLVLLGLAECAHRKTGFAFPSLAELVEFTSLDRKSVISNLDKLEAAGFIKDTGNRVGRTHQIKVYTLTMETVPKAEPSQKRNDTDIPVKSTENGTRNQLEPVLPTGAKAPSGERRKRARSADFEIPDWVPGEAFSAFIAMRAKKKKPVDSYIAKQLFGRLRSITDAGWNIEDVINKATVNFNDGFWMPDGRDQSLRRVGAEPKGAPRTADQLENAIRFRIEQGDEVTAEKYRKELAALRSTATGPPRPIGELIGRIGSPPNLNTGATR